MFMSVRVTEEAHQLGQVYLSIRSLPRRIMHLPRRRNRHSTDLPLTEAGRQGAEALGRYLAGRKFDLVLSSPLARAAETCRLAGYGEVARFTDDLMEWDYGEYEGLRPEDILKKRPGWTIWNDGVPGGETVEQAGERARNVVGLTEAADGDAAVFSHSHLLRILAACWLGLPLTQVGISISIRPR